MRRLPIGPVGIVVMPRSDVMFDPWNDQDMVSGWSPCVTIHDTWAKAPSFMMFLPNERGRRSGGSKRIQS